jgi:hypothetical protein
MSISSHPYSSRRKELYNLAAFIVHAASLCQACAHCRRFLAAASRRSLDRVSVPVWPYTLSGRLSIVALVGRYPTNWLMDRRLIHGRSRKGAFPAVSFKTADVFGIISCFHELSPIQGQITYVLLTRAPLSPNHIIPKNQPLPKLTLEGQPLLPRGLLWNYVVGFSFDLHA